jgi:hypothetical protein
MEDLNLTCRDCQKPFCWTAAEQEEHARKKRTHQIVRCKPCRDIQYARRNKARQEKNPKPIPREPDPRVAGVLNAMDGMREKISEIMEEIGVQQDLLRGIVTGIYNSEWAPEGTLDSKDLWIEHVHECPKSPTTYCCYDQENDPAMDSCLFCYQPYERK